MAEYKCGMWYCNVVMVSHQMHQQSRRMVSLLNLSGEHLGLLLHSFGGLPSARQVRHLIIARFVMHGTSHH